jgi:aryl-alcohol dehydrogenase-like predicted oxidoreductase
MMSTTTFLGDKPINRMGYGAMQLAGPGVFGPPRDASAARAVLRRAIAGVEANLRSLAVERLDLVNLRLVEARHDTAIPLQVQLAALEDMRHEGKLDLIGLSNVDRATVELALEFVDIAEIQNGYSIIDRQDDELVEFARRTSSRTWLRAGSSSMTAISPRSIVSNSATAAQGENHHHPVRTPHLDWGDSAASV